jgi:hypothetical protein
MKKGMKQCMIIAASMTCIIILGFFGCNLIPGKGNLDLTIESDIDPNDIDTYDITLYGPDNTVKTEQSEVNTLLFTDLSSGLWGINVKVKASDKTVLEEENDHVIVEKDKTVEKIVAMGPVILTPEPTAEPTEAPTDEPTPIPTDEPTPIPTGGSEIFGSMDTFTLPPNVISVTYSKVTVIGGGGGGDGAWCCGTSSGSWCYYGGGGGAGEVKTKENVIEIGKIYTVQPGSGGSGGSGNESTISCPGPGCNSDDGEAGQNSTFSGDNIDDIIANGGGGAKCQSGGSGYPPGTSGSECFSSANPPGRHCNRTPPDGIGGDNGTEYGNGGDGSIGDNASEDGQDGAIIILWEGLAQP